MLLHYNVKHDNYEKNRSALDLVKVERMREEENWEGWVLAKQKPAALDNNVPNRW